MNQPNEYSFATTCVHGGQKPDPSTGAIMTPIFLSSTYVQEEPGQHKGYEYSRTQNPTRKALEANLAQLEEGDYGFCFASGCAATTAILLCLKANDHVVSINDLYGGTYRLFTKIFQNFGLSFDFAELTEASNLSQFLRPNTKLIWIETPTNPLLKIADIEAICRLAHEYRIPVAVDNTFATPYLQKPLRLGADLVVHSTTKYLGGHSDILGGAVITNNAHWAQSLAFVSNSFGGVPSPLDCFLALRGIKTLEVRMVKHDQNAQRIAQFLAENPNISKVYYPGLKSHPQHGLAQKQMKGFGGIISFVVKGGEEKARQVLKKTRIFACAESLGGVESLISHPATMTHASIPQELREKQGIVDGLIRLSVGIEEVQDLEKDLEQAIK